MDDNYDRRKFDLLLKHVVDLHAEQAKIHARLEELITLQEQILSTLQGIENNTKPETF